MGELWRPNVSYEPEGFKVEYEGMIYELIHPHTSQMGWEPTQTPAFWKVSLNQEGVQHRRQDEENHQYESQNLDDPNVPYKWVPYTGSMPKNALGISNSRGKTFFVARATMQNGGGVHPGYSDAKNGRCFVGYGGKEVICEKFEVLVIEPNRYQWIPCPDTDNINGNPVIGGYDRDKNPFYICKCLREGVPYFGKTSRQLSCAYYSYGDKEHELKTFEVLIYN
ncbi:carbohydrate-binding module family 12 protein [Piromyces sp. E2]|nr:carbohydrate-binding module family 12 protein [Piromyces sp. E2]|eukprot:OUM63919.1 carbohydrate-binding module family 12 protein [Piromyces sp. E2]